MLKKSILKQQPWSYTLYDSDISPVLSVVCDSTAFVVPAAEANAPESAAAGSAAELEKAMGLPDGLPQNTDLLCVDVPKPPELGLRMPSGNEAEANSQWIPGGRLPGWWLVGV